MKPHIPDPADYLDSSKFCVRIYQDLGTDDLPTMELPNLSNAVVDYVFEQDLEPAPYEDSYFPFRSEDSDEDESAGGEDEDEEAYEEPAFFVTLTYLVNLRVVQEIHGAFPLPSDANLVIEVIHFDEEDTPVFRHVFRGWPSQTTLKKSSVLKSYPMEHTLVLECEEMRMFELIVNKA